MIIILFNEPGVWIQLFYTIVHDYDCLHTGLIYTVCIYECKRKLKKKKYSKIHCAEHFDEPLKTKNVFSNGFSHFLSLISIAQKEFFHISICQPPSFTSASRPHILKIYSFSSITWISSMLPATLLIRDQKLIACSWFDSGEERKCRVHHLLPVVEFMIAMPFFINMWDICSF